MLLNFGSIQKKMLLSALVIVLIILPYGDIIAQCAMCKAVLETNMQGGGDAVGGGINSGILYIMAFPYLLASVMAFIMYRHFKKTRTEQV